MTHGVVAVGDSIINGTGPVMAAIHSQSWALHVAQAAGWCFIKHSVGGSTSEQVAHEQLPKADGQYRVGAVSMGANDAMQGRSLDSLPKHLTMVADVLAVHAERTVILNLPDMFGSLPGAGQIRARVDAVNAAIDEAVTTHGLILVDVRDLTGPALFQPDRVHPTALGQLTIGQRACQALRAAGVDVPDPSMGHGRIGPGYRAGHALGTARQSARAVAKRVTQRVR